MCDLFWVLLHQQHRRWRLVLRFVVQTHVMRHAWLKRAFIFFVMTLGADMAKDFVATGYILLYRMQGIMLKIFCRGSINLSGGFVIWGRQHNKPMLQKRAKKKGWLGSPNVGTLGPHPSSADHQMSGLPKTWSLRNSIGRSTDAHKL